MRRYTAKEKLRCTLCVFLSGKVKIYKEGVGGRSQIIRVLKTKEYFAYRAFFCRRELRDKLLSAFEPCTICLIPMPAIMKLIKDNSELALFFIRQLSIDLGISDERTVKSYAKTYSWTIGGISVIFERYLWSRRR